LDPAQLLPVLLDLAPLTTNFSPLSRFSDIAGDNTDSIAQSVEDDMIYCFRLGSNNNCPQIEGTTNSTLSINLF
jgi:hypothetical protein